MTAGLFVLGGTSMKITIVLVYLSCFILPYLFFQYMLLYLSL